MGEKKKKKKKKKKKSQENQHQVKTTLVNAPLDIAKKLQLGCSGVASCVVQEAVFCEFQFVFEVEVR
jgi:hypothetical protein